MATLDAQSATTLIACGITAVSTLSAVLITSLFNNRQARINLDRQAQQKSTELRLAKLEELYLLFEKWQTNLSGIYMHHLRCYVGKLTYKQVMELTREPGMLLPGEHQKMLMLLNVHFPELVADHAPVNDARSALATFLSDPAEKRLSANDFVARQKEFEDACRIFKGRIVSRAKPAD